VVGRPSNSRSRPPPCAGLWRLPHGRRCQRMEGASARLIFRLPEPAKAKKVSLNANCLALSNSTPILQRGVAVRFFPWFPRRRPHRDSKPSSRWKLREIACSSQIDSIRSMAAHWLLEQAARDFTTEPCHRTDRIRWESGGRCAGRYPACGASIGHHHELSSTASSQAHGQRYLTLHHGIALKIRREN
jgi:hypothetical protein